MTQSSKEEKQNESHRNGGGRQPTKEEIKAAREQAGLNMSQAAALIYCSRGTWLRWEAGERRMHPAMWELFNIKMGINERKVG